jgi:hypothetical protein
MATFGSVPANSNFSQLTGTVAADDALAGNIGEVVISTVAITTGPSLTSTTAANVTSISLTAGDWDVTGQVIFEFTSATQSGDSVAAISGSTGALNSDMTDAYSVLRLTTTTCKQTITLAPQRANINGTLSRFLVAQATFSAGSCKASGFIRARRIR